MSVRNSVTKFFRNHLMIVTKKELNATIWTLNIDHSDYSYKLVKQFIILKKRLRHQINFMRKQGKLYRNAPDKIRVLEKLEENVASFLKDRSKDDTLNEDDTLNDTLKIMTAMKDIMLKKNGYKAHNSKLCRIFLSDCCGDIKRETETAKITRGLLKIMDLIAKHRHGSKYSSMVAYNPNDPPCLQFKINGTTI